MYMYLSLGIEDLWGKFLNTSHFEERQNLECNIKMGFEKIVGRGVNKNKLSRDRVYLWT